MHEALRAVFREHRNPSHCSKQQVQDQLAPILRMAKAAQLQLVELKALVAEAGLVPHNGEADGTMEHIHQTLAAAERRVNAFVENGRAVAQDFAQLERYLAEQEAKLSTLPAVDAIASDAIASAETPPTA